MELDEEGRRLLQMTRFEEEAYRLGYQVVAGLDEAGRGPLAGPVVAAACVLPKGYLIRGVNDSKKLSPSVRKQLFSRLTQDPSIVFGIGVVQSDEIDRINIYEATKLAMRNAAAALSDQPDYLLIDGMGLDYRSLPFLKIIKGDQLSLSIAAASIIAKETRDQIMIHHHEQWPEYGFVKHKGYGTELHRKALEKYGPCPIHRHSFEPVKTRWPQA